MIKLQTKVDIGKSRAGISYNDKILVLGSCFADNIGQKLIQAGFNVCLNPFGTLYNPVSVNKALESISNGRLFSQADCVEMGAGAGLFCSFSHHTSFARPTAEEFLDAANAAAEKAHEFYKNCNKAIITLGTSWCYVLKSTGDTVANCLKRNASEFRRERLSLEEVRAALSKTLSTLERTGLGKDVIFTVSPIRHMADGAHGNQLSKSLLLLALDSLCEDFPDKAEYFPAYEIMLDELRDYRFYAEDMVHPSGVAINYLWEKFCSFAMPEDEKEKLLENEKLYKRSLHRPLH